MVFDTVTLKAFKLALTLALSLTVITIPDVTPTASLAGVPVNAPVVALKAAQLGLLVILKVCVSPASTSLTLGVKL